MLVCVYFLCIFEGCLLPMWYLFISKMFRLLAWVCYTNTTRVLNKFYSVVIHGTSQFVKWQLEQMLIIPVSCWRCSVWVRECYLPSNRGLFFSWLTSIKHPNVCVFTRYLEWAVIPDRPWPASRMEEDHRHGRYLLLAHPYRHHPVGEARHPSSAPWSDGGVPGPSWPHHGLSTT